MWSRAFRDQLATIFVSLGGICVIISIVVICFFLVYVVVPLFGLAHVEVSDSYTTSNIKDSFYLSTDEYVGEAVSINKSGKAVIFKASNGEKEAEYRITEQANLTSKSIINLSNEELLFGLDNGKIQATNINYKVSYPDDVREVKVEFTHPYGKEPIATGLADIPIKLVSARSTDDSLLVAIWQKSNIAKLIIYNKNISFLDDSVEIELDSVIDIDLPSANIKWLGLDELYSWLYVVDKSNQIHFFDIRELDNIRLVQTLNLKDYGNITAVSFLNGNLSLLLGFDSGRIIQAFPVRDKKDISGYALEVIREFPALPSSISFIRSEYSRKGFLAATESKEVGIFYSSNGEKVADFNLSSPATELNFSPREDAVLAELKDGSIQLMKIDNEYPEVSFSSLWSSIWYESYDSPDYIWQSSASTNDFEPKFSLSPLTFGTIKAAFYAMLIATPLAIMAAIYTAFFLSPILRQWIKPIIEIMEALPTVILGFLAGLWLAPFMEENLTFIFLLILAIPLGILAIGYGSTKILRKNSSFLEICFSEEWRVVIVFIAVLLIGYLVWVLQEPIENLFFGGSLRLWISNDMGISFDQRNALVVGTVMGFAVIPTIFSIAEDAVFAVPKHLVNGSLALGASNWQTLVGVVLPTASPGIFSGVMIGMGRAVGETMIVLMATGNTPVMDFSVFEGMRTLSANIAVEMPEAEVGSSHYRILFLAGLVLFVFTFFFNTLGEIVRQRVRKRYGSL